MKERSKLARISCGKRGQAEEDEGKRAPFCERVTDVLMEKGRNLSIPSLSRTEKQCLFEVSPHLSLSHTPPQPPAVSSPHLRGSNVVTKLQRLIMMMSIRSRLEVDLSG